MKILLKKNSSAGRAEQNSAAFSFSITDDQGKMVLRSESYRSKDSAKKGIRAVKKHCLDDKRYILNMSSHGMYYFNLKSANGVIVATSGMYSSEADRHAAIRLLKSMAPICEVEETVVG